jgi:outer membrane receptor protein involved in Fe transport
MIEDYFCHTRVVARCIGNPGRGAMGGPEARRTSTSLNAWAKDWLQVFDERVDWQLDYTWSRSRGNTEMPELTRVFGIDPYARTAFDRPQFVPPDQPLANERRHVASAWSSWNHEPFATSAWVRWSSGAPLARFGYSDFYGRYVSFLSPRGSEGRTPNVLETSFDVVYSQKVLESSNLELKLAVDNLFNRQTMLSADQRWAFEENANSAPSPQNPNYLRAMTRVAPRSVRLSAKLVF